MGLFDSIRKRGVGETIRRIEENVRWDAQDILPTSKAPLTVYENIPLSPERPPLLDRLLNRTERRDGQAELWKMVEHLPPGTYATRDHVGSNTEGTGHNHFFVIDRDSENATFLFVDPEHYLNRSRRGRTQLLREGDIRPKVCNLMTIRIQDANSMPDIAITRFRTSKLADQPEDISFKTQLLVARDLFKSKGIPPMLQGKEEEIIFRLVIEPSSKEPMLVQSRYTNNREDLRTFLQKGTGFSFLKGKVRSFAGLTGEFLAHLKREDFKPRPDLRA